MYLSREPTRHGYAHTALGLAIVGLSMIAAGSSAVPRLVWNASASAPLGLYLRINGEAQKGDYVFVQTPVSVRALAAERGYLPANVPLIKRVAATKGDLICAVNQTISINGIIVANRMDADREGRVLPSWFGCRRLTNDEVFLLMAPIPDSFDGRYFGPISRASIIGKLVPLWLE